ncbi:response regulator [Legionella cherrii]|uniref:Two-component response regulator n=1 Tax=Legionella cherrii TaxID=28084 RepID=A0ABY6T2M1_9GAMM|nr:response regulator [Legionella cherrii]VEB33873.1 two-component response regulator [Legionella cherrii]
MRVLIIEDNAFNAFCLSRLLESVIASVSIDVVSNSQDALSCIDTHVPDLVIIDGELNLIDELSTHGPQLAAVILQKYPHLPIIAWSDSEFMRSAFAKVFIQSNRLVNEYNTWTKTVNPECIQKPGLFILMTQSMKSNPHTLIILVQKDNPIIILIASNPIRSSY